MTQSLHAPRLILVLLLPVVLAAAGFYLAYQSGWRASEKPTTTVPEPAPNLEAALKELDRADQWNSRTFNRRSRDDNTRDL